MVSETSHLQTGDLSLSLNQAVARSVCWLGVIPTGIGALGWILREKDWKLRHGISLSLFAATQVSLPHYFGPGMRRLCPTRREWNAVWMFNSLQFLTFTAGLCGGMKYFERHNIESLFQAMFDGFLPGQLYFKPHHHRRHANDNGEEKEEEKQQQQSSLKNRSSNSRKYVKIERWEYLRKIARCVCYIWLAEVIRAASQKYFGFPFDKDNCQSSADIRLKSPKEFGSMREWLMSTGKTWIKLESVALYLSMVANLTNIFTYLGGLVYGSEVHAVGSYAGLPTYLCTSSRQFWKNWSRPIGEQLRWAYFEPVGGRQRPILGIVSLFGMNCISHFSWSMTYSGDPAYSSWIYTFTILGSTVALEMAADSRFKKERSEIEEEQKETRPDWYRVLTTVGLHCSAGASLYLTKDIFADFVGYGVSYPDFGIPLLEL